MGRIIINMSFSGIGGVFGPVKSPEMIEEALEQRGVENVSTAETDDFFMASSELLLEKESLIIGFNGVLEGSERPAEQIFRLYRKRGRDMVEKLTGDFVLAIFDREKKELLIATDKVGNSRIFYTEREEFLAFSSHLSIITSLQQVDNRLDREVLRRKLLYWPASLSSGRTMIQGVYRMKPSQYMICDPEIKEEKIYWDPYGDELDVSDTDAVEKIDDLLGEAVQMYLDEVQEVNVAFSGGFDSSLLVQLLQRESEKKVNTYTYGFSEEILERGRKRARELGTEHHDVELERKLPGKEEVWKNGTPFPPHVYYGFNVLAEEAGPDGFFVGGNSTIPFPVSLGKIRKLGYLRSLPAIGTLVGKITPPVVSFLHGKGIIDGEIYNTALNAADLLSSNYMAITLTRPLNLNPRYFGLEPAQDLEREIESQWPPRSDRLDENMVQQDLRMRANLWSTAHGHHLSHHEPYSYSPLLEFALKIPINQRKDRRLERKLAEEKFDLGYEEPGGAAEVADQLSRAVEAERRKFESVLEDFMEREIVDEYIEEVLRSGEDFKELTFFKVNAYLIERWLQAYIDREEPWRSPD
ncbi:MAG: asparagine synthase-related protein [Candidatus Nanohaloarchaea archaeon]